MPELRPAAAVIHDALIAAGCPVSRVAVGRRDDRSTWEFVPAPDATPDQIAKGRQVLATVDINVASDPPLDPMTAVALLLKRIEDLEAINRELRKVVT